ncbi:beta-CASP ribonuclease aCPSF1 [Candidatus Bathyarchaeota archaeon]|nr:MAG: beta-CASP ribonuclease aCPSF1 [Candidatus Bathyarchaeota archaeon]
MTSPNNELFSQIIETVLKQVPKEAEISRIKFEGPRVAIYTMKPEVLVDQSYIITYIVGLIKKRIVIRSDPSVRIPESETKKYILELISKDAEITKIDFDPALGEVIIEAKKPGLVMGQDDALVNEIIKATKWRPIVLRSPPIQSKIIANIRHYLHSEYQEREGILRRIGERIFRPQILKTDSVRLTTLGGFQEVGRSAILIQTKESKILLDCGINPGSNKFNNRYPVFSIDSFDLELLDAVIISHTHLDHCGFLPFLYKYGYDGPVYCSEPTASLMTLLQLDYLDVTRKEGRRLPYTQKDVRDVVLHTIPIGKGIVTDISPDVRLTFHNAGHILGSVVTHLHIGDGLHNLVYTSDFKFGRTMLLEPATTTFPRVETLIVESTYGSAKDIMPARVMSERRLVTIINTTIENGGKVLIPVPAVGRAQEIMLVLDSYIRQKSLKEVPIFIEGMVKEATAIHTAYPEYLAKNIRDLIFNQGINPFQSDHFIHIKDHAARQEVLQGGPCIILATSGMLEGGPAIAYFKEMSSDERNMIVFVSYQIEGTLGRKLQKGSVNIRLINDKGKIEIVKNKLQVNKVEGFSGHSDRNQIIGYARKIYPKPERIIVGHGEKSKCIGLSKAFQEYLRIDSIAPKVLETIRLK